MRSRGGGLAIHDAVFGDYFAALSAVVAPAVVGRFVRHQRIQSARLHELSERLEREREHRVAAALSDERARIARELHDVIAIQSDAADAEMRRLLSVLRDDEDPARDEPQPGLDRLGELVSRATGLGIDLRLDVRGTPAAVPASLDLSAYRIIQEALTNVHKHAGDAPTEVSVVWRPDRVELCVHDRGSAAAGLRGDGHGLVGMRERVRLHGGSLDAGPARGGGFRVRAVLPLGPVP